MPQAKNKSIEEDKDATFIKSLCDLEIPNSLSISPNRRFVLYATTLSWGHYSGTHQTSTLWLATSGEEKSARKLTDGQTKDYAPAWHPDGDSMFFISDREEPGCKWAIYSLAVNNGEHGEIVPITDVNNSASIEVFKLSPDGKQITYLSADEIATKPAGEDMQVWGQDWQYTRLRIYGLNERSSWTLPMERHILDFCWNKAGTKIAFISCGRPDFEERFLVGVTISILDVSTKEVKDFCHLPCVERTGLLWADDGKLYMILPVPLNKLFCGHGVYCLNLEAEDKQFRHVSFGVEDDADELVQVQGQVLVRVSHRLQRRVCRLNGNVLYTGEVELEGFGVAFAEDGTVLLAVAKSDVNSPVEVFTTCNPSGDLVQVSNHGQALAGHNFGRADFLHCASSDGEVELDSIFLSPSSSRVENPTFLPTVVLIHGGPNTCLTNASNTYYYMWAPYLLSKGYGILIPMYRGSYGRGSKFAAYSLDGVGHYDYEDIIAGTQHAIEEGYADKERLIIGGWSQGGFLTFLSSMRNGSHGLGWQFKAAIAGAGIVDSDAMALTSDMGSVFQPGVMDGRVMWNMQRDDTRNRRASPLWEFAEAVKRGRKEGRMVIPPMLILHGEKDARCHVSNAWGMRRALESQKLPFEMVVYPRQGHFFHEQKFWIDMAMRVARWCEKYIGRGSS